MNDHKGNKRDFWKRQVAITMVCLLLFLVLPMPMSLQAATSYGQTDFSRIYNLKAKGEIKITGNTLMAPSRRYHASSTIDSAMSNPTAANNSYMMELVDFDQSSQTTSSSSAAITVAPGASIEKAFLVWGASTAAGSSGVAASNALILQGFPIKFKTPDMNSYTTLMPTRVSRFSAMKNDYSAYTDVTDLVKAGGAGTYWAGDIAMSTGGDTYGGWSLIVVYKDESKPKNDLSVFFGHQIVSGSSVNILVDGLITPPSGPVRAKLGVVAWEGDGAYAGDYLTVGRTPSASNPKVSTGGSPESNFFNSRVTEEGAQQSNRSPNYINNMGIDAKVVNIDGVLSNNQDTLGFTFGTNGDVYYPTILTSEIEQYAPDVKVVKSVKNLSSQGDVPAKEGDILEYTLDMKNIGYDTATLTVATDTLPEGVDYVPGSIAHIENGNPVKRTDQSGDDDAEYIPNSRNIQLHVGTDSTAEKGGKLVYNQQSVYTYHVRINPKGVGSPIVNKVSVNYSGSDGKTTSGGSSSGDSHLKTETAKPSFDFKKTTNKGENYRLQLDDEIEYVFIVKNTGNVSLSDLKIADQLQNLGTIVTDPANKTTLAPNEMVTAKAKYKVTQADVDRGKLVNQATATLKDGQGNSMSKEASTTLTGDSNPEMTFKKSADHPSAEEMTLGKELTYTFTVKNTGNVTLKDLKIEDPHPGIAAVTMNPTSLAPGQTAIGTAKYKVTQADMNRGSILNIAKAKATAPDGTVISRTGQVEAPIKRVRDFDFQKTTDKDAAYKLKVGDVVKYSFKVMNTGNVTLNDVTVEDPLLAGKTINMDPRVIEPGKSSVATVEYIVTQADVNRGELKNTAKATVTTASGSKMEKTDSATLIGDQKPAITFKKTSDKSEKSELKLGDIITYTFSFKNDGNVTLKNLTLTDPMPGMPTKFDVDTLDPGKTATAMAKHTVTQEDMDRGYVENTATASATDPNGKKLEGSDTVHLNVPQAPRIQLDKTVDPTDKTDYKLGDEVTYRFKVTNTGNVTLKQITLEDPLLGGAVELPVRELAPGASTTATGKYQVTQADLDAGEINNTAMVNSKGPQGGSHYDMGSAKVKLDRKPAMQFTKSNDRKADYKLKAGDEITYTFKVENTGNVTLKEIKVDDPLLSLGKVSMEPATIAPGATAEGTAKYTVTQADVDRDELVNTATATAKDPAGTALSVTDTNTLVGKQEPGIEFEKTTTKKSDEPFIVGEKIPYSFVIRNTGNVTLNLVKVDDPLPGLENVKLDQTELLPGGEAKGTAEYTVTQSDIDAGKLVNKATASAMPPKGSSVSKTSSVTLVVPRNPAIQLEKTTDKPDDYQYVAGDTITYTFKVTNTGNVTLNHLQIIDPLDGLSTIKLDTTSLQPGQVAVGKASYAVTLMDMDRGKIENTATVIGKSPDGKSVESKSGVTVQAKQQPALTIEKVTKQPEGYQLKVGDLIVYSFKVLNTGNVTLRDVIVSDPLPGMMLSEQSGAVLAPGEEKTLEGSYIVKQADVDAGKLDNQAKVQGKSPSGTPVFADSNKVSIPAEQKPDYTFEKTSDKDSNYKLVKGEEITYTFTVTNTGNVTLNNVKVIDPMKGLSEVKLDKDTLAPGDKATATAKYTITQEDVDKGAIVNKATSTATPPATGDNPPTPIEKTSTVTVPSEHKPAISLKKSADKTTLVAGETITYSFEVENTGNVTLTDVALKDEMKGLTFTKELSPIKLAPGEKATATATYVVTQTDVDKGKVENTATVTGTPPTVEGSELPNPVTNSATATVPAEQKPDYTFVKTSDKDSNYKLVKGEEITYTFTVTNTGNVTLNNVKVTDPMKGLSEVKLDKDTLAPGEKATATATYTITQEDVDKGAVVNKATSTATPPTTGDNPPTPIEKTSTVTVPSEHKPAIKLTKTADKTTLVKDETITYSFEVENTGNVTLTDVALKDEMKGLTFTKELSPIKLVPGEKATATATYVVTQTDVDKGKVENTATVTGTPPTVEGSELPKPVTNSATATVPAEQKPDYTFEKTSDKDSNYKLVKGEEITYTFTVTNTGNVTLNNVSVKDPMKGLSEVTLDKDTLAPGEKATATATYTITQEDVDKGAVVNKATSTATPPATGDNPPTPIEKTSTVTVPSEHKPAIKLTKTADKTTLVAGETITYSFEVENTGNVTLSDVTLKDEMKDLTLTEPLNPTKLAPGEKATAKATYVVKQADVDKGNVENTATVTGTPPTVEGSELPKPVTNSATATVPAEQKPDYTFEKTSDKDSNYKLVKGEEITYTFTVTNTGNVTLNNVKVTDPMKGLSEVKLDKDTLAPGEKATATAKYTITQEDVDAGKVVNTATATGIPPAGDPIEKTSTVTVPSEHKPAILLKKSADKTTLVAGETITYSFEVENTGNVTLTDVALKDEMKGLTFTKELSPTKLAPGEKAAATATYVVTQADVDKGKVENEASVTGNPPTVEGGTPPTPVTSSSKVSVPSDQKPDYTFEKTSDKDSNYKLVKGEEITYTFTVTNTGNVTLNNVSVKDPMKGLSEVTLDKDTLAPGEKATATATYTITQEDVDKGAVVNKATSTATPPATGDNPPTPIEKTSTVTVPSEHKPAISLKKSADKTTLVAGETITYSFEVENTGNVTLSDVALKDEMKDLTITEPLKPTTLAPGEKATAKATYVVTQADVDKGKVENTATVTGTPPTVEGSELPKPVTNSATATVPAEQKPDYTFEKTSDKDSNYKLVKGEEITYTFTVTNTGNVTLNNVKVTDPMKGLSEVKLDKDTLAPGEKATATAKYTITQEDVDVGKVVNEATATATSPVGNSTEKKSSVTVPSEHKPAISLKKSADKTTLVAGETITYSFEVENSGNVTLSDVILKDEMKGLTLTEPLNPTKLAPGEKATATATYVVTQADVDKGKVENTATVTGTPPTVEGSELPKPVTNSATATVPAEQKPDYTFVKTSDKDSNYKLVKGEEITYTFTVTNTGNVTLNNVKVTDPMKGLSEVKLNKDTLAPGDKATATAKYTITQEDVDAGKVVNEATATATPPTGDPIEKKSSVTVPAEHTPDYIFTKSTDKEPDYLYVVGDTITYTFIVENTGNVTLTGLSIKDPMEGLSLIELEKTEIQPGEKLTTTATYTITQADVDRGTLTNVAKASACPPQEGDGPSTPIEKEASVTLIAKPVPPLPDPKPFDPIAPNPKDPGAGETTSPETKPSVPASNPDLTKSSIPATGEAANPIQPLAGAAFLLAGLIVVAVGSLRIRRETET